MKIQPCATCEAFVELPNSPNRAGMCRRNPPTTVINQYVSAQTLDDKGAVVQVLRGIVDSYFAPTRADLGCMEWVERTTPVVQPVNGGAVLAPVEEPVEGAPIAGLVAPTTH